MIWIETLKIIKLYIGRHHIHINAEKILEYIQLTLYISIIMCMIAAFRCKGMLQTRLYSLKILQLHTSNWALMVLNFAAESECIYYILFCSVRYQQSRLRCRPYR